MSEFRRDTALTPRGPNEFAADLRARWWIARGANGGYLAAILVRALAAGVDSLPLRTITIHYTAAPEPGPVDLRTETLQRGRGLVTRSARMEQGERLIAVAIAGFAPGREGPVFSHSAAPSAPPPEACPPFAGFHSFHERWEYRWAFGGPPGADLDDPVAGGWIRSRDPSEVDTAYAVAVCDAFSPPYFTTLRRDQIAPIPTLELTVHLRGSLPLRGLAAGDFLLARFESTSASEGYVDEVGGVWTRDGALVAECRQLATFLRPRPD